MKMFLSIIALAFVFIAAPAMAQTDLPDTTPAHKACIDKATSDQDMAGCHADELIRWEVTLIDQYKALDTAAEMSVEPEMLALLEDSHKTWEMERDMYCKFVGEYIGGGGTMTQPIIEECRLTKTIERTAHYHELATLY